MHNEIKIFENVDFGQIRTAGTSEEPLFCLSDVCKILGLQVQNTKQRLKKDGVYSINLTDKLGRNQQALFISEQNLYKVIMRSDKPQAEAFQDWVCEEVLPSIRKTGKYENPNAPVSDPKFIETKMKVAEWAARMLNMNDAGKLMMVKHIADECCLPVPEYVQSKGVMKSTSTLCKERGLAISGRVMLAYMEAEGLVETKARPSSKGGIKKFKCLTADGLEWGENAVHPMNQRETQILLYADRFDALVNMILPKYSKEAC